MNSVELALYCENEKCVCMINKISWASYYFAITLSVILYYLVVLIIYYKDDIKQLLYTRNSISPAYKLKPIIENNFEGIDHNLLSIIQSLFDETTAFFNEASHANLSKEDILNSLKSLLSKYPGVRNSPYTQSIDSMIFQYSKDICSIHLSAGEVDMLWKG